MSDIVDQAETQSALLLACSIENARLHVNDRKRIPTGICHNCYEKVKVGQLFCDSDCNVDFKKRHKNDAHH